MSSLSSSLPTLPRLVLRNLFYFIAPDDAISVFIACKLFRDMLRSDFVFWKNMCLAAQPELSFDFLADCLPPTRDWKWLFLCCQNKLTEKSLSSEKKITGLGSLNDSKILYLGEWREGKPEGKGLQIHLQNKSVFVGDFLDGQQSGFGVFSEQGKLYKGNWEKKKRVGFGYQEYITEKRSFEGEWKQDQPNGRGIYIWGTDLPTSQQERYEGEFLIGRRHGAGNYTWPTGDRYEGNWKEGRQDGFGTYFWKTGSKYEGMWKENKKHGFGTFVWPNGDNFEGEWEDGIPVEVEMSMHEDVKRAIAEKQCTNVVEGLRTKMGQLYKSCTKCSIRVCVVCSSTCHSNSHLHSCPPSSVFWSSLNNCGCSCCLSS